jgi:ABC-type amino acid transport substrate-binding protein
MKSHFITILLAVLFSFGIFQIMGHSNDVAAPSSVKNVHAKVLSEQKIRCGYGLRPPFLYKDTKTNQLTGFGYDVTEELGKRLSLKIEWAEEIGFGTIVSSLKSGRIDMACGSYWPNAARAREINFTIPFAYEQIYVYQRASDKRAFSSYQDLNNREFSFGSIDGSTPALLQTRHFPLSVAKSLPELSAPSETFEDLVNNKIDFVINPAPMANSFEKARPNSIKPVINQPLATYPMVMFLPANDLQMATMVNIALEEMILDGTLDQLIAKNGLQNDLKKVPAF